MSLNKSNYRFIPSLTMMGKGWYQQGPSWRDFLASLVVIALILLLGAAAHQMVAPFAFENAPKIDLSPSALPMYALRTVARMLVALLASLVFTFTYATLAAKSRRAEMVLIPLLDVLQSVPILGYLSFTVLFFVSLFPGNTLGLELASIFAVFTSQAWNMAFSFYQSLRMVPIDLDEASQSFRLSGWQRFWRLEVPFAIPGLIWNMMMSMSGGWFFVVAAEAISVGQFQVSLPGVGSYVAQAIQEKDLTAIGYAILAMSITILIYDQLFFRPLVAWSEKFRVEDTASQQLSRSFIFDLFSKTYLLKKIINSFQEMGRKIARMRFTNPFAEVQKKANVSSGTVDYVWFFVLFVAFVYIVWTLLQYAELSLSLSDLWIVILNGFLTLFRVAVLIALATAIWVPVGIYVGSRPALAEKVQPIAQFFAAFPANLFFPLAVFLIVHYHLNPIIWLTPLMILGTQWYILFNVIAGMTAFPSDLKEAAASFRIGGVDWWWKVIFPGILPYYVTGAITASGGAWNASIVSEVVTWGQTHLNGLGLGAYIAEMTIKGDYPRIALGIAVMSSFVIVMNRLFWRPLYAYAESRSRLN